MDEIPPFPDLKFPPLATKGMKMNKEQAEQLLRDYPHAILENITGTVIWRIWIPNCRALDVDTGAGHSISRSRNTTKIPDYMNRVGCKAWKWNG
jgi:hypothetical protein